MAGSFDLGYRNGGEAVRVELRGGASDVLLLDEPNFSRYRTGSRYQYTGGRATRSPVLLRVPHAGRWHVVVDPGSGDVRAAVTVLP